MTKEEFEKFVDTCSTGIILFKSEYCKVCEAQSTMLESTIKGKFSTVCCDYDPDYFVETVGVDLIPNIRIYEDGVKIWEREDLISPEDLEFIKAYVETNSI